MTSRLTIVLLIALSGATLAGPAQWFRALQGTQRTGSVAGNWYTPYQSTALAILPMEEGSGSTVTDLSVYASHATNFGASAGGTNGWLFDGTDDYIQLYTNFGLSGRTSLTVSVWIDNDRVNVNDGFFGCYPGSFGQQSVDIPYGGSLFFLGNANDYNSYTDDGADYTNGWKHFCFVYDGTLGTGLLRGKAYFNATNKTVSQTGAIPTNIPSASYANWNIGRISGLPSRLVKGRICRFMVLPQALDAASVSNLYNTSRPGVTQ